MWISCRGSQSDCAAQSSQNGHPVSGSKCHATISRTCASSASLAAVAFACRSVSVIGFVTVRGSGSARRNHATAFGRPLCPGLVADNSLQIFAAIRLLAGRRDAPIYERRGAADLPAEAPGPADPEHGAVASGSGVSKPAPAGAGTGARRRRVRLSWSRRPRRARALPAPGELSVLRTPGAPALLRSGTGSAGSHGRGTPSSM